MSQDNDPAKGCEDCPVRFQPPRQSVSGEFTKGAVEVQIARGLLVTEIKGTDEPLPRQTTFKQQHVLRAVGKANVTRDQGRMALAPRQKLTGEVENRGGIVPLPVDRATSLV